MGKQSSSLSAAAGLSVLDPTVWVWLELQDLCVSFKSAWGCVHTVKVLDVLLWFAEASKDWGLLGSRQADFLLVCSWVPHSYMLIIPRIEVVAVLRALVLCQTSCRSFPTECFPPLPGLLVLLTLLYFSFFPELGTVFQKPRKGSDKRHYSISVEWIKEWVLGSMLSPWCALFHLNLMIILWDSHDFCPHITKKKLFSERSSSFPSNTQPINVRARMQT